MNNEIERHYPKVAEKIYDVVPENFQAAYFHMEVTDDVWGGELFYSTANKEYKYKNENLESVIEEVKTIRELHKSSGEEPFTIVTFILMNTGKFSLEFGYDDISDFGRASERRDEWINKQLGEEAKIDWY
ncbi:immunity protein YezG family protein [Vreelandella titanicae]|uniref:immunity protein YezG family protein n=1 Tax=Vreelandella titanicae TaxID=664683 RepID=UPI0039BF2DF4